MASINFKLCELVDAVKKSAKMPNQIKQVVCEQNKVKIIIDPGKLSPKFTVFLTYDKFHNGKIMFNITSQGPTKLIISILHRIGFNMSREIYGIDSKHFTLDINDYLKEKFHFVEVKDIINKNDIFSIII